jgi:hypothetical protein
MTATGLEVFDDTLHKTNTWLKEIAQELLKEIAQELSVDRHGPIRCSARISGSVSF